MEKSFDECFGQQIPDSINESHKLIIVAAELDDATERIVKYLNEAYDVPLNTVFFRYFKDNNGEYIARSWLVDPAIVEVGLEKNQSEKSGKEPWNGVDYYISLGEGPTRNWDECSKFGFISAGQGRWYSKTLEQLKPGARVFVHIPNQGYVGVGIVREEVKQAKDFDITIGNKKVPITEANLKSDVERNSNSIELSEYMVRVEWIKTFKREDAVWEKGFFANQNTVCKLRNKFTLERLKTIFEIKD